MKLNKEQKRIIEIIAHHNKYQLKWLLDDTDERRETLIQDYMKRKPIIDDLRKVGIDIEDLDGLENPSIDDSIYTKSIPILVSWLKRDVSNRVKASIISVLIDRAISKQESFKVIMDLLPFKDRKDLLGTMVGNAFLRWVDDENAESIFRLLEDKRNRGHSLIIGSLANFKKKENKEKAIKLLIKEIKNPKVHEYVLLFSIIALRKLKAIEAIDLIQPYTNYKSNSEIRTEAKKAIKKFQLIERRE